MSVFQDRMDVFESAVAQACTRVGRDRGEVECVLVTKYVEISQMLEALSLGYGTFGESRVQQLCARGKDPDLADVRWHMIGRLQRNKVRQCLGVANTIHSVHSFELAKKIDAVANEEGLAPRVYVQVNTSGEPAKQGCTPEDMVRQAAQWCELTHIRLAGLMTMAPFHPDPEQCRSCFRALRALRERLLEEGWPQEAGGLSMGMSNDYKVAIEEGATVIRVGSAIFGDTHGTG